MPSSIHTLPLYLGKCIEDLVLEAEKVKLTRKSPKLVCKSLGKLLDEGEKHRLNGDDELAYIVFMRWIDCIRWLQKTPEFKQNKDFLKPHVSGSKVKEILKRLEDMSQRLKERYQAKRLEDSAKAIANNVEKMQIEPEQTNDDDLLDEVGDIQLNLPDTPTDDPANKEPEITITCMEMFQEMKRLLDRIIILDIRDPEDFNNSHIDSDRCMNIPAQVIVPGKLAIEIFRSLVAFGTPKKLLRHRAREYCDLIVLLDWHTTKDSLTTTNPLHIFRTILWDWDPGVAYNKILVLDGGYKEWLNRFPSMTTNPKVTVPDVESNNIAKILEEVEYPDLVQSDEDQPMIEVISKPIPERSLKPKINKKQDLVINKPDTLNNRKSEGPKSLYNTNTANIYRTNAISPSSAQPNIVDDSPFDGTNSAVSHETAETSNVNDSKISHNVKVHGAIIKPVEKDIPKPVIDRSSKPNTVRKVDPQSEKILDLLRQEKEVLKSQLKLGEEKLSLESQLFGREDNEDDNFEQKDELIKRIDLLNSRITEKLKRNTEIKYELRNYRRNNIDVEPAYHDEKTQLELDIGLAEHDVKSLAIQRKVFSSKREKKLEENLEIKQKNISTPPRAIEPDIQRTPLKNDGPTPNSGLKRSYSSPNLAQLETRKELGSRGLDNNIPQVDRTSKPLQQLQQNQNNIANNTFTNKQSLRRDREQRMSPVYGDVHPGITGLKNLGNSCYMNSIIQCLSNTTSLARYFIQGSYIDDLNTKNRKTESLVVEEVAQVIKALWCGHYRSISPRDLKVVIGQYRMQFENYEQQDSHEFLTFLLEWMHSDLKTKAKLEIDRTISNAEKEWDKAMDGKTSIISQLFFGQLRSTISCATCEKSSTTYENFNSLTLSLPDSTRCTLDDCIRKYLSGQRVSGWRCPSCEAPRDAMKKFDFVKLAPIIVVHLNRFGESDGWIQKINTAVDFPLVSLDLRSYVAHEPGTNTTNTNSYHQTYNLYAVSNHYGTMDGGHYTAYCNSASQNKWYKYDDHTVREVSPTEVKSQTTSAYLLFYTSVRISPFMVM